MNTTSNDRKIPGKSPHLNIQCETHLPLTGHWDYP